MRKFRSFSWKDTNLRVASDRFDLVTQTILAERKRLEAYIRQHPLFKQSLKAIAVHDDAPEIAKRMAKAAQKTGLGPMASVAGTLAQVGAEAAIADGCDEIIVENGGDMFVYSNTTVTIGIYAGTNTIGSNLAFRLKKSEMPLAICSSSSKMGHSISFGQCELATVLAREAALADSAATMVCNKICADEDLEQTLDTVVAIEGIQGILAVKNGKIGLVGNIPELVRNQDSQTTKKITKDSRSNFDGLAKSEISRE